MSGGDQYERVGGRKRKTHIALLDAVRLEDVGGLANFLKELLVGELDVLSGLISLPDDSGLFRIARSARLEGRKEGKEREVGRTLFGCL
jgi:hypothetical protein